MNASVPKDGPSKVNKKPQWSNYENNAFYQEIKPEGLQKLAMKAGLLTGCDIKLLKPYWQQAEKILDVGSGFGRVVDALLACQFNGEITAIERNELLYQHIKKQHQNKVKLFNKDIHELHYITEQFDVIFFLWSALADFSPDEQPVILSELAKLLTQGGKLIVDTIPHDVKPLDTEEFAQRSFLTRASNEVVHTYEPTYDEMMRYATESGLNNCELLHCTTDTSRIRWLYVLSH